MVKTSNHKKDLFNSTKFADRRIINLRITSMELRFDIIGKLQWKYVRKRNLMNIGIGTARMHRIDKRKQTSRTNTWEDEPEMKKSVYELIFMQIVLQTRMRGIEEYINMHKFLLS